MTVLPPDFLSRPRTAAHVIAEFLARSGVRRIYGLTGGHIKPIWAEASRAGIRIIHSRHEAAAVHMAQADADLSGELAVAVVTTGPGLTNAVTGIANAYNSNSPILVLSGLPPRPQLDLGAVEELTQVDIVRPITQYARTVRHGRTLLPLLHAAVSAAIGDDGLPGPAFLDFPIDVLREPAPPGPAPATMMTRRVPVPIAPTEESLDAAAAALRSSRRPLLISGRGANADPGSVDLFLETTGALYLDTGASRGLVRPDHPAYVPATRAAVMAETDLVITIGRELDFALAYGSAAVFAAADTFLRIGRTFSELKQNRVADIEVRSDVGLALRALAERQAAPAELDIEWRDGIRQRDRVRRATWLRAVSERPLGDDGRIHPNTLLHAISDVVDPDDSILIADGGDILSFARIGLTPPPRLDPGAFGCLGVGVPFATAASLCYPDKTVIAVVGDGAFGFNAMELDTARREGARPVVVVANNEAWNIERIDQAENYAGSTFSTELPVCRYDALAQALGLHAVRLSSLDELKPALEEALLRAPAVVEVEVSREPRSPDFVSGLAELPDLHALRTWEMAERALLATSGWERT